MLRLLYILFELCLSFIQSFDNNSINHFYQKRSLLLHHDDLQRFQVFKTCFPAIVKHVMKKSLEENFQAIDFQEAKVRKMLIRDADFAMISLGYLWSIQKLCRQ
jgi:hypothetical protein